MIRKTAPEHFFSNHNSSVDSKRLPVTLSWHCVDSWTVRFYLIEWNPLVASIGSMTRNLSDMVQNSFFHVDSQNPNLYLEPEAGLQAMSQGSFVLEIFTVAYQCAAREDK
jgi:hypothetical protein